ncbi:MAG: hypothetical protein IT289_07390 [Oligoflexia bacterium]|nr:hypothetical protein [Oligoflexia bacterium]
MNTIQKQLSGLLWVLFIVTVVNSGLFFKTHRDLQESYEEVMRVEKIISTLVDLQESFFEESKFQRHGSSSYKKLLNEVRQDIRRDFKDLKVLMKLKVSLDALDEIERQWSRAQQMNDPTQLLIYTRSLISNKQRILKPLGEKVQEFTKVTNVYMVIYLVIFALVVFTTTLYLKNRIFAPLNRLNERMRLFEAGEHTLDPVQARSDEIGVLERQFHQLADRVAHTVEDLKEIDRVKTDFISIVSHELRTPMTSVKGSLSLLLSGTVGKLDDDTRDLLEIAEKESDRLIRLINDILDLTKMEAKKMPLNKRWVSLFDSIKNATQGVAGLCDMLHVKVTVTDIPSSLEIYVDTDRIQQVLTNLLSNAIKFSPKGSSVEVFAEPTDSGAWIRISDKGPGIRAEDKSHLFQKFSSKDTPQSKVIRGTGLGLAISKAIVEQHGGRIEVESVPGSGSVFSFFIPDTRFIAITQATKEAA